jgi:hypothetical protein
MSPHPFGSLELGHAGELGFFTGTRDGAGERVQRTLDVENLHVQVRTTPVVRSPSAQKKKPLLPVARSLRRKRPRRATMIYLTWNRSAIYLMI